MMEIYQCVDVLFLGIILSFCFIRIYIGVCLFIYLELCKGIVRRRVGRRYSVDSWEGVECLRCQMGVIFIDNICE